MLPLYLLLACLALYYIFKSNTPHGLKKLPTPPGHFFHVGREPHKKFTEWARSLGDIYGVHMGQQYWIILTGDKVVGELLQKRGGKYSSRITSYYTYDLLTRGKSYFGCPYNERYRMLTPIMHGALGQRSVKENSKLLDNEFRILMQNLCNASTNAKDGVYPKNWFQLTSLNIITILCLNKRTETVDDPFFTEFKTVMEEHMDLVKITNRLSEFFPIMKLIPNTSLRNKIIANRTKVEAFLGKLIKEVENDKEKKPCIIRNFLHKKDEGILDELDIIYLVDAFFAAGTDTIASSLTWLSATLANNPEVQSKAHQELDRVIGQSRLPEVSDEQNLPYIRAIIKEGQRYCAPIYLGVPHGIEEDDEYNGYHIPANSVVVLNQYGIHMDEKRYENPKEFKPERFLGVTESSAALANRNSENRDHFGFGAGRRLCTGIHMAERELFLGVSHLLWCFRIENASPLGEDGKPIPIDLNKVRLGISVWPEDYRVKFIIRHDNVEKLLFGLSQI
ncbi:4308_t:CDS:2 [Cetraspora pellucida]|uniref:4308_t:CDS:1 n=1 Tax=Cetraspora pellucida TaxID=1433469 RepID=A0A9N9N8I5_9GLOM|nr:4308_t:CDS:2 [Cetraspora pellucida]